MALVKADMTGNMQVISVTYCLAGMQVLMAMRDALDLVCQANIALTASVRKTAGWLGDARGQPASTVQAEAGLQPQHDL